MVEGLERFAEHFAAFADQYVLIGGAACTLAMEDVGQSFRATKDLDIVLCVETLKPDFVAAFWQFVRRSVSDSGRRQTGQRQYYRFLKPASGGYTRLPF